MSNEEKVIRTPSFVAGPLTNHEKQKLAEHHNKWMRIATRTQTAEIGEVDNAIRALYSHIKQDSNIPVVIVPSPVAMMMVFGIAETIENGLKSKTLRIVPDKNKPGLVHIRPANK